MGVAVFGGLVFPGSSAEPGKNGDGYQRQSVAAFRSAGGPAQHEHREDDMEHEDEVEHEVGEERQGDPVEDDDQREQGGGTGSGSPHDAREDE